MPHPTTRAWLPVRMSYILNSISACVRHRARTHRWPTTSFVKALKGKTGLVAQHVMYNWIVPSFSPNVDAAKEFLLHYTANLPSVTYQSKLYDFPRIPDAVPDLDGWLDKDPFGANPPDKLAVLKDSTDWCTNIGHPGPASPAIVRCCTPSSFPTCTPRQRAESSPRSSPSRKPKNKSTASSRTGSRGLVAGPATTGRHR